MNTLKYWIPAAACPRVFLSGVGMTLLILIAACGSSESPTAAGAAKEEAGHGEAGEASMTKGPHGGRLLQDGTFAVEITIFERGVPPEFRVYPTQDGKPVAPGAVTLNIELRRLGDASRPLLKSVGMDSKSPSGGGVLLA